jgi:hypothetical protein
VKTGEGNALGVGAGVDGVGVKESSGVGVGKTVIGVGV